MNLQDLKTPFSERELEWRISRSGKNDRGVWASAVAYITSRAIMDRLDNVCGPENWCNEFQAGPNGGVVCCISIRVDEEWVGKWDGADNTNIESVKGGLSDSMKRAAVQWGIGRYLYNFDETFVDTSLQKANGFDNYQGENKNKGIPAFYWRSPMLGAKPKEETKKTEQYEPEKKAPAKSEQKGPIARPMDADQTKAALLGKSASYTTKGYTTSEKQDKLFSIAYQGLFLDDRERYAVTEWIFGFTSSKEFTGAQKRAVIDWLSLEKTDDGKFVPSKDALSEKTNLILAALRDQGQQGVEF